MGKKARMRRYPQKFGKKFASHSYARALAKLNEVKEEAMDDGVITTEEKLEIAAAEAMESISEKETVASEDTEEEQESESSEEMVAEETAAEEVAPEETTKESESSLMKLKKDELVEKAKAAGVATSGTKADIVARLLE